MLLHGPQGMYRHRIKKPQKRDLDYYERRLINEHPSFHTDFLSGKYPSLTKACQAAGLMARDTTLKALKRSWKNASSADRKQFTAWLRSITAARSPGALSPLGPAVVNGYVEIWAGDRIHVIMDRRRLTRSNVMDELGLLD